MKKFIFAALVAVGLMSCGVEVVKTGPEYSFELVKSADFEDVDTSKLLDIGGIKVQGDYVSIEQFGTYYDYKIDKVNSYECVEPGSPAYYAWWFFIEKVSPAAFNYDALMVKKYMDESWGEDPEMTDYVNIFEKGYNKNGGYCRPYDVKGRVDIPRHFLPNYSETKLPEIQFSDFDFRTAMDYDSKKMPVVLADAKSIVIKGTNVEISDGTKTVKLDIYPYSDRELFGEDDPDFFYTYRFVTKAAEGFPKMSFAVQVSEYEENPLFVLMSDEDADGDLMGGFTMERKDFKSWGNLKRKICVCYPSDEDYTAWKKKMTK